MKKQAEIVRKTVPLSAEDLVKNEYSKNKRKPVRVQQSKPPKNAVKIKETKIAVHFTWALVMTILCFFTIGPCWALWKTGEVRRLIQEKKSDDAAKLSNRISTVLVLSTILGVFAWVSFLFCSVGLLLTGKLLDLNFIWYFSLDYQFNCKKTGDLFLFKLFNMKEKRKSNSIYEKREEKGRDLISLSCWIKVIFYFSSWAKS